MNKLSLSLFFVMLVICMTSLFAVSNAQVSIRASFEDEELSAEEQFRQDIEKVKFDPFNVPEEVGEMTIGEITKEVVYIAPAEARQYAANVERVLNLAQSFRGEEPVYAAADQDLSSIDWSQVINIAKQAWKFIEDNKAVSNYQQNFATILPKGVESAFEMEKWKEPQLYSYKIGFKNLFGITVTELVYSVSFVPGGQLNGKGRYLDRVTIIPTKVYVAWGWKCDAKVTIPSITNAGSSASPIAAAQAELYYKIGGLNSIEKTESFYVRGDGQFKWLNQISQ